MTHYPRFTSGTARVGQRRAVDASTIRRLVDALPRRERFVITRSYGLDTTVLSECEIAHRLGVSPGRVRMLHEAALERLRGWLVERAA